MKTIFLITLLLPSPSLAIDPPAGSTIPVTPKTSPQNAPNELDPEQWAKWANDQLEKAKARAAVDYVIANPIYGAKCIYSTDENHPTDTIDIDVESNGYKVSCFALKNNDEKIYVNTYRNMNVSYVPAGCADSAKIREHFSNPINRKQSSLTLFHLKFSAPSCTPKVQNVSSQESALIDLKTEAAENWFKNEMEKRTGLKKPGEKAINSTREVKFERSNPRKNCLPGNPLCQSNNGEANRAD